MIYCKDKINKINFYFFIIKMSQNNEKIIFKDLVWNDKTEDILRHWHDICTCYYWLHERSYRIYNKRNYAFSIPTIIFSTITGTLGMGTDSIFPEEYRKTTQLIIGGINIATGIITTLQTFFRYSQESGLHHLSCIDWGKLKRMILLELGIERHTRQDCSDFILKCYNEIERLHNSSPVIPKEVIKQFKKMFGKDIHLVKPDLVDQLKSVNNKYPNLCKPSIENIINNEIVEVAPFETEQKEEDKKPKNSNETLVSAKIDELFPSEQSDEDVQKAIKNLISHTSISSPDDIV